MGNIKEKLRNSFSMKDLDEIYLFLWIQFDRRNNVIEMGQSMYLKNILKKFDIRNCEPRATPWEICLSSYYKDEAKDVIEKKKYWEMVGSLVYLMICTQPDLSNSVTKLSQHLSKPNNSDWVLLKHVFQYIKGTVHY